MGSEGKTARTAKAAKVAKVDARDPDRKATILRAAIEVFATKGFHGTRIADVAREAKVAYGLVYHYYKDKDELLQSVFQSAWDYFVGHLQAVIARGRTLDERVRGICDVAFEAYRRDPRAVRVLVLQVARSPTIGQKNRQFAFESIIKLSLGMFEEARGRGELRDDLDPMMCALLLFGALEMGMTAFVVGMRDASLPGELDRAKQQVADVFLGGVCTPEATWKSDKSSTRSKVARRS